MIRPSIPLALTTLALSCGVSQWALSTTAGNDLVTVTIRAKIEASSQFRDGEVREDEKVAVSYSETTVRRIVPLNSSSCDIKEVSHTP